MVRKPKKSIHPKYHEFLDKRCYNVKPNTLYTYAARFRGFPDPDELTVDWFIERMKEISPYTAGAELIVIKMFKKWAGENIQEWKEVKLRPLHETVTVEDLYTREELQKIFAACTDTRDRAMLQVLYESAVRSGELLTMKIANIKFFEDGSKATISVKGKTGTRIVWLRDSVPALIAWLNVHPFKKGVLWTTLSHPIRPISASGFTVRVRTIMYKAKLGRRPKKIIHMFRHTRITEMVNQGIRGMHLRKLVGWSKGSNMESVYVHLSTADMEYEVKSKLWGEAPELTLQPMMISGKCPRCGINVAESDVVCTNCSFPLTADGIKEAVEEKAAWEIEFNERMSAMEERRAIEDKKVLDLLMEIQKERGTWGAEQFKRKRKTKKEPSKKEKSSKLDEKNG